MNWVPFAIAGAALIGAVIGYWQGLTDKPGMRDEQLYDLWTRLHNQAGRLRDLEQSNDMLREALDDRQQERGRQSWQ